MQGRTFQILTILSALSLFAVSDLSDDIVLQAPNWLKMDQPYKQAKPNPSSGGKSSTYNEKIIGINRLGFVTSNTNLRSGAGTNFKVILTMPARTELEVRGKVEGRDWYIVKLRSQSNPEQISIQGYVHGNLLAIFE